MIEVTEVLELQNLISKKWTLNILKALESKPATYNEIKNSIKDPINPTLLSERLKELIKFKLVQKKENDGKIIYSLTEEQAEFKRIQNELHIWIEKNK